MAAQVARRLRCKLGKQPSMVRFPIGIRASPSVIARDAPGIAQSQ